MTDQPSDPRSECLLIYDGECRFCVAAKQQVEQLAKPGESGPIRMITYQSDEARQRLGAAYVPGRPDAAFLVQPSGKVTKGLDAFLPLLPGLRWGKALALLLHIPLMAPIAYAIYAVIARHRYRLFGAVPLDQSPSQPD